MTTGELLNHLHRGASWRYLWTTEGRQSFWCRVGEPLPAIPANWRNVYVGVHPTAKRKGAHGRATVADVTAVNCLFAEFDAKDHGDKAAIEAHLDNLWRHAAMPWPTAIIDSGGGYHCYWLLERTAMIDDSNRGELAALQRGWVAFVGGDPAASDLARVLRLPGTTNHKYEPARPVTIIEADGRRLYRLEDFAQLSPPIETQAPRPTIRPATGAHDRYAAAALAGELDALARTGEGGRNDRLNRSAFALGTLAATGALDPGRVGDQLHAVATAIGLGDGEATRTIASGLKAGMSKPRQLPERTRPATAGGNDDSEPPHSDASMVTASPQGHEGERERLTDLGNAWRFTRLYGADFRYTAGRGWMTWDGRRWQRDDAGAVQRAAKQTVLGLYEDAAAIMREVERLLQMAALESTPEDERAKLSEQAKDKTQIANSIAAWAKTCQSRSRIEAIIALAQSELPIAARDADFDNDPWLLNCQNGTIDLRTGKLRPHDRREMLTTLAPTVFDPNAKAPTWERFLHKIMGGNERLIAFLRRMVGYGLTGDVSEQVLFFLHGSGANGKSTFMGALFDALGNDYAIQAAPDLLIAKNGERHPTELADLQGKRIVASIEVEDGRRMAEGLVKQLTGGDRLKARYMREDFFQFSPTHKLFLIANHKPVIRGTDYAIWRRIRLIPFDVSIPDNERDPKLPEKLRAESSGILAWAVRGCLEWQRGGLAAPQEVMAATEAYRQESDTLGAFLADCTVTVSDARTKAGVLYAAYQKWAVTAGLQPMNQMRFGSALTERGIMRDKNYQGVFYLGIGLLEEN